MLRGTWSRGFRAPTFAERDPKSGFSGGYTIALPQAYIDAHGGKDAAYVIASQGARGGFTGNPDLKPEKSRSAELGLGQQAGPWNWALNAYQTRIDQLITLDANYYPMNISQARIRGAEGQLGVDLAGWQLQGYLTWLQPRNDDGGPNDGKRLPRRPERTARVDLDRRIDAFGFGATVYVAGRSYDDVANLHRLGGYSTTDLRASWHFGPQWEIEARLANVFDRDYETVYYFNQPGRAWYLTLRYGPADG
jgi:vitamin B12 transporter